MISVCPQGHSSQTSDYCDQCGTPIETTSPSPPPGAESAVGARPDSAVAAPILDEPDTSPSLRAEPCPACGTPRQADDRYCEGCGHDFLAAPPEPCPWEAVVAADRAQFERLAVDGLDFPGDVPERRVPLDRAELRIGRSRGRPGEVALEIDLAGAVEDPGVSHLHAVLVRRDDGTYAVRDLGSTNGTTVNDDPLPVSCDTVRPLAAGDVLRIGVWTTLTIRARGGG